MTFTAGRSHWKSNRCSAPATARPARRLLGCVAATVLLVSAGLQAEMDRASVVKVTVTRRSPDPAQPWTKMPPMDLSGSGAVIEGNRILTNAHVVNYASQVYVQPFQSSDKVTAKVEVIAPEMDLAVLSIEDPKFFESRPPLKFAEKLPHIKDTVNVYGYPVGGSELSVTEGIVSRIDFSSYLAGGGGLLIQVDAALNPGNSGGPAISNDEIVGLVFSRMEAENIGYLIPVEEIRTFLADAADGKYEGKPQMFDSFQTVENDALRAKLGLPAGIGGAMVQEPGSKDKDYPLKKWDVITQIGEHEISPDGKLTVGEVRLSFRYWVDKLAKDGKLPLTIVRDGRSMEVELPVSPEANSVLPSLKTTYPRYFVFGPLVFSAATQEYLGRFGEKGLGAFVFRGNPLAARLRDTVDFEGEELVVVAARMFPHRITKDYSDPVTSVVDKVNGIQVKNLRHLAEILRDSKETFDVFEFAGAAESLVFRHEEMKNTTEEILSDNGIRYQCSEDLRDLFE